MSQAHPKPLVVLIHGIASGRSTMWPLAWWLRRAGFQTQCFGYPSCFAGIESHGQRFYDFLARVHTQRQPPKLHIVAHSMGGIVTRQALMGNAGPTDWVDRIVLLGTPQKGSPQARFLTKFGLRFIKSLQQLSDHQESFVNSIPEFQGLDVGTISASYDWVVPANSSRIANEADHIRPFSGHNGLLVRPKVAKLVVNFLKQGQFRTL